MQPQQSARARVLFWELRDLPEGVRSERLRALTDDPAVIAEVRALLDQTDIDSSRKVDSQAPDAELKIGDRLDVWTLVGEIGHGGMGTVFRAQRHDGQFEQVAAIKLLRGLPSGGALERLAQERQILAKLAHPNIARLLDGGATPRGQPYLVLEFVDGEPIDRYCYRHKLALPAIIELMLGVSEGLSFAHQRLIVHCDLKPSNILVNAEGRPILLDFGIARLLNQSVGSHFAARADADASQVYTPGYASPEQRAGAGLSTATDVYGLGRVLQNLLCEAPESLTAEATADTAVESRSVLDSARLSAKIPVAIAAIVHRATADNPALRYISASAFADDLRRYSDNLPVVAMGAGRWYRARCYMRRNALALALGTFAALALLGGLVSTALSLRDARLQRRHAEVAAARAERTAGFLSNLLSAVDPDRARDLDKTLLHELLDQAATSAQTELAKEPLVLSQISGVIGNTYYQLGEYDVALKHLRLALDLLPPDSVRERLTLREKIADSIGATHNETTALGEYEALYRERLAAFGPDDPDTVKSEQALAFQWVNAGEYRRAAEASAALQPRLERVLGPDAPATLENLLTLAAARGEMGEYAVAEETFKALLERQRKVHGDTHSRTFAVQNSIAIFYLRQGRNAEAEAMLRAAYPVALKRFGPRGFVTINFASMLGSALRLGGKLSESGPYYRRALDSARAAYGESSGVALRYGVNYANFEVANGEAAAALVRLREIEPMLSKSLGAEHPDVAELHRTRGRALTALKQTDAARDSWQLALDIDRKVFGSDTHPQVAEDLAAIEALSANRSKLLRQ